MSKDFIKMTQGPAVLADETALKKDEIGLTRPNLHRRILTDRETGEGEYMPREYELAVRGVDSYRTTQKFLHDESSVTSEIP